jgi:hypothetical protein
VGSGGRGGYPGDLWDRLQAGVQRRLVVGILVVVDPAAWPKGRYSGVVWVWGLEAGEAGGRVSCHVWIWNRAVAWRSPRVGEPAEWSSASEDLWGGDLAGLLFFY